MDAVDGRTLLMFAMGFLVQSGMIAARLQTTFGKVCLVSLTMMAVAAGIVLLIGGVVMVLR